MSRSEYIHEVIEAVVDSIRYVGPITEIVQLADGNWSAVAENTLVKNDVVSIRNDNDNFYNNIMVLSAVGTSFTFGEDINYDDQYNYSYKELAPYFLHENKIKANEILTQKNESTVERWKKYPLVLLLTPFTQDLTREDAVYCDLSIAFLNETEQGLNSDQRYAKNFKPILDPIYDDFLDGIVKSRQIRLYDIDKIQHKRDDDCLIDEKNPLPDYLDGILTKFINLPFKRKC